MAVTFVNPNLWILSGGGITIRYSDIFVLGPASGPHLVYQNSLSSISLTFDKSEIREIEVPDLGKIVSVTIQKSVDFISTSLSLLLPVVNIIESGPISSLPVNLSAIITAHLGPNVVSFPLGHGQRETYTVIPMSGSASYVIEE
jgi:hypothetical protein